MYGWATPELAGVAFSSCCTCGRKSPAATGERARPKRTHDDNRADHRQQAKRFPACEGLADTFAGGDEHHRPDVLAARPSIDNNIGSGTYAMIVAPNSSAATMARTTGAWVRRTRAQRQEQCDRGDGERQGRNDGGRPSEALTQVDENSHADEHREARGGSIKVAKSRAACILGHRSA